MKTKRTKDSDQVSSVLARFAARRDGPLAAEPGAHQTTERERRQAKRLLDEGYSVDQLLAAVDQAFDSRPSEAKPIHSFGFVLSYVRRRLRPTGHPPTQVGATEDVLPAADAERTTQPAHAPLERISSLLEAASVRDVEGADEVLYGTPGIRLGLRSLLDGPNSHSSDEVYDGVLAALSRNIQPNRLVGYVTTVLENARAEARLQQRSQENVDVASERPSDHGALPTATAPRVASTEGLRPPDEDAQKKWQDALATLGSQMTGPTFETWIRPTSLLSWNAEMDECGAPRTRVVIGTPDGYIRDWLESRLATPIQRALSAATGSAVDVQFHMCNPARARALQVDRSGVETPCPDSAS